MNQRELTPPYVRYLARLVRPYPDWDFFFMKPVRQRAVHALQLELGNRVIDAGCGPGGTFPYLADAVGPRGEVVGIEMSPEAAINAGRRIDANHWKNVRVVVGDAKAVKLSGAFDGLVMFAAPDIYASSEAVANLFASLKPGARVVIFGAKLSTSRLGTLPNILFRSLMKLSHSTTPKLDEHPLSAIEHRMVDIQMQEYMLGCIFLAWGSRR